MTAEPKVPWRRRLDPWLDPVLAVLAAGLSLASLLAVDVDAIDPRLHEPNALATVATAVAAGSLGWRRSRPVASFATFVGGAFVVSASFHYIGILSLLMLLSLFSLATYGSRRDGMAGLAAAIACFAVLGLAGVPDLRTKDVLLAVALLVATWALAEALRARREQQAGAVRAAVTEERLRIARDLHDVVAHSMSLIAVQAGAGAHVIRTDPEAAEQALGVIADTSRQALAQTRSMLGILRDDREPATRPPTQGLDDLGQLLEGVRAAGLDVHLVRSGSTVGVEGAVSLAAYRMIQESLTNVLKHSAAASATVSVDAGEDLLELDVTDPGPARRVPHGDSSGHGLVGLDERARLLGGSLTYGAEGAGYRVHARLPVEVGR